MDNTFHTTHWTQVLAAKDDRNALRSLCELYYAPVLHYIKRQTQTDEAYRYGGRDAEDLAQDFIVQLLDGNAFEHLERQGNRFRTYLLGAVRHFLAKIREKESTEKRGRNFKRQELPAEIAAGINTGNGLSDAVFDRIWAKSIIDRVLDSLADGTPETERLMAWLTREVNAEIRKNLAAELNMNDTAVKVALHRLRKKFRTKIRAEIAVTVDDDSEIDGELQYLIAALQN